MPTSRSVTSLPGPRVAILTLGLGVAALLALAAAAPLPAAGGAPDCVVTDFPTTLEPGVWHGFILGTANVRRGYVLEATPLEPGADGDFVEILKFQPEFDGTSWNDVMRVQLPAGGSSLDVQLTAYSTVGLPLASQFDTTLMGGDWHGFGLGPASADRGYAVEVSPLAPAADGNFVETAKVQPEFDGVQWNDVLRLQTPVGMAPLDVNVRVYETTGQPVLLDLSTTLEPGVWHGFIIGPAASNQGHVAEVSPLVPGVGGDFVEIVKVQQEFDGFQWNDVLRVQIPVWQSPLDVNLRVYGLPACPGPGLSVSGVCPGVVTIAVDGATPNGQVALLGAAATGSVVVPSGACAGLELGLAAPSLLGFFTADGNGDLTLAPDLTSGACGRRLQAVETTWCGPSGVAQVP